MAATFTPSDLAPAESVHYSLANSEFDLGGSKKNSTFKTDDPVLIANALDHPWITVTFEEAKDASPADESTPVFPADDPTKSLANDPDAVAATEAAKAADTNDVALDAGKDQGKVVITDGLAETLAADAKNDKDKS